MKYRKFGSLDWNVSEIGLGCWQIGADWGNVSEEKANEVLQSSFGNGVNFFDTAELYSVPPTPDSYGKTEIMIGNWFKKRKNRDKIILATKVAGPGCDWIRGGGNNFSEKKNRLSYRWQSKKVKNRLYRSLSIALAGKIYKLFWQKRIFC